MKKLTKKILKEREKRLQKRTIKEIISKWKLQVIERDDWICQKCGKRVENRKQGNPHHIITERACKRDYPELLSDINNGIFLCYYCHRRSESAAHVGALEFIRWFKINKYTQYEYLTTFLDNKLALHQTLLQKNCELLTTLKVIPVRIKP